LKKKKNLTNKGKLVK